MQLIDALVASNAEDIVRLQLSGNELTDATASHDLPSGLHSDPRHTHRNALATRAARASAGPILEASALSRPDADRL